MNEQVIQDKNVVLVIKASGEEEPFDIRKLEGSLFNAGAGDGLVKEITKDISEWIYSGVTTKKIYNRAFQLLKRIKNVTAIRYKLKQSMIDLGPTGYPFEYFIGKVFENMGYAVKVGQVLDGMCITHEMDVIATKDHQQHLVECKFRLDQGKIVSVQTSLYVRARIDDILKRYKADNKFEGYSFTGWVVTNTRFSSDCIKFGESTGLQMLGWDYPYGNGLKSIIEREKIYPITALTILSKKEKTQLLDQGVVTCEQLYNNLEVLDDIAFVRSKSTKLLKELNDILNLQAD
jgi:hypothetical protein